MKVMMAPRRVIKFAPKIKELDRQYEMNNNAELDNGVYHNEEEEDGGMCNETKQSGNGNGGARPYSVNQQEHNLATSFGKHELESQLGDLAAGSHSDKDVWDQNSIDSIEAEQQIADDSEWRQIEKGILSEDQVA